MCLLLFEIYYYGTIRLVDISNEICSYLFGLLYSKIITQSLDISYVFKGSTKSIVAYVTRIHGNLV